MKLNFDYYKKDIPYNVGKNEKKVIKYIVENSPVAYEKIIKEDNSDEVILSLSTLRNNIVYAYDFKENASILELGAHLGEVTNLLCKKAGRIVAIETVKERAEAIGNRCQKRPNLEVIAGDFKEIEFSEKFDYITLFGILEYAQIFFEGKNPAEEMLLYCKKLLKEDGKLLIATNNKFAMRSYVGIEDECTNHKFDSITGYKSSRISYKLGKKEIEKILNQAGFQHYQFFYPLPDYKLANAIYSDDYLPSSSKMNAYLPYYMDESNVFYSEADAYDTIVKEDKKMFPFFANSYLIEASQGPIQNDTKYVSFNNYRKKKYRLMTKIRENIVEKSPTEPDSRKHLSDMNDIIGQMHAENIKTIDCYANQKVTSKFIEGKLVSQLISDNLDNKEYILNYLKQYRDQIYQLSHPYEENEELIFHKFHLKVDKEILKKWKYLKNGYWDMIFKNCFWIENQFVYFDQEWVEKNIPAEFLIYRCIVNIEKLRDKIEEYHLYEELGIKEYISIFEELDRKIFKEVFDEKVFGLYVREHQNPIYENAKLKAELNQEKSTVKELEKSIQNLSNEIFGKDEELKELRKFREEVVHSRTWKIMEKMKKTFQK